MSDRCMRCGSLTVHGRCPYCEPEGDDDFYHPGSVGP